MYTDVPCISWLPLSTIVTLLLRWASYCVCTSNARCDAILYCLVLLVQIHSELRELLSPLLFVDGSLYTNDVVLLFYHVLQECPSECVNQWIIRTHFLNVRSQERIWGVICAGDFNYVYVFEFGILNQTIWSLARCDIVKRFYIYAAMFRRWVRWQWSWWWRNVSSPWNTGRKSWLRNHRILCIAAALSMRMARSSARGVPCNAMNTAASSARVLECWPPTRSDLWGMAASCHMTPVPMAGSFVLDRFSRNDPSVATTW